jgi:hypothetical protein
MTDQAEATFPPEHDTADHGAWDTSGVTDDQTDYFNNLIKSLQEKWPQLNTTTGRNVLSTLNDARKRAGIPFIPYD